MEKKRQKQRDTLLPESGGLRLGTAGRRQALSESEREERRYGLLTLEKWGRRGDNRRAGYKQVGL